jgi:hypothetical protein
MNDFVGRWRKVLHAIKDQFEMPGPNMALDREPMFILADRSRPAADVVLDPDAQHKVAPTWNKPPPDFSEIFVLLVEAKSGDEAHIEISINEEHLGSLSVADSHDFLSVLATAGGQPVVGEAIRDRNSDGGWALHVYRPQSS